MPSKIIKTAEALYVERTADIAAKLEALDQKLAAHSEKERMNPKDYGFAGDLAHVDQVLGELLDFFSPNV